MDARDLEWILGHRMRQRERSLNGSWDDFRNHELLEVLLNYAVPRQDMSGLARRLTGRYGSVLNVLCAPEEELLAVEGMTPAIAGWLNQAGELATLYRQADRCERISLLRFRDVCEFLRPRLSWVRPPECWVLYTDFEHCLVSCQRLGADRAWWHPDSVRRMVEDSVSLQARNAVLVLFRGGRSPRLTDDEKRRLRSVNDAFNALQVALSDCVLVGDGEVYSMFVHDGFDFLRMPPGAAGVREPGREEEPPPPAEA